MSNISPEHEPPQSLKKTGSLDQLEMEDVQQLHAPIMREQAEPRDGFEPIPLWLTIFYGTIVFWGGYYLASYNGGFQPDVYDEHRPVGRVPAVAKEVDPLEAGQRLYTINCSACHQSTGTGVSGQFPPLADSEWVEGDYGRLVRILLHGLEGPVEVQDETYNGNMPAFGTKLDDQQLSMVLSYIRQAWGNSAAAISSETITSVRAEYPQPRSAWGAAEIMAIDSPPLSEQTEQTTPDQNAADTTPN